jgi:hypothetical protein
MMPSGITHLLLSKTIQEQITDPVLKAVLQAGQPFFQTGAVGPDLPYASIADNDFFFTTESELADRLHYENTNQVPLKAFSFIKQNKDNLTKKELRSLFCFFSGYLSHIAADGIIHPFIRDVTGDYKTNQEAHRILEMKIDVIYLYQLTLRSGYPLNLNSINIHDELRNIMFYPERKLVMEYFSRVIKETYNKVYKPELILSWVEGLHRMFDVAEGEHPHIYKNLLNSYLFKDIIDLHNELEQTCTLTIPKDRTKNFLQRDRVHLFEDCIPKFFSVIIPLINKAYKFIYKSGNELTEADIYAIDLDTGRGLASTSLDDIPLFWS